MFLGGIWRLDYQREQFLQKHFSPRSNFLLDFDLIWREQVGALKIFIIIKKRCKRGQKVVSKERKGDGSQAISIVQVFLWLSCLLQKENTFQRGFRRRGLPLTRASLWFHQKPKQVYERRFFKRISHQNFVKHANARTKSFGTFWLVPFVFMWHLEAWFSKRTISTKSLLSQTQLSFELGSD